jgi:hypothetical protein
VIGPIAIDGATVETDDFGGMCPVQGSGRLVDTTTAGLFGANTTIAREGTRDWYFRARGQHWTVAIGRRDNPSGYVHPIGADLFVAGPSDDIRPYSAGYMEADECARHLTFALTLWTVGIRGVVEIPDPPEMRGPCFRCGAPGERVEGLTVRGTRGGVARGCRQGGAVRDTRAPPPPAPEVEPFRTLDEAADWFRGMREIGAIPGVLGNPVREGAFNPPKFCACGMSPPCRFCIKGPAGDLDDRSEMRLFSGPDDLDDSTLSWR